MNPSDHHWQRLAAAARRAPDRRDESAPYGFATRVAALALAAPAPAGLGLERLALRAFGIACLVAVLGVLANYTVLQTATTEVEGFFTTDDPASIVLDVS